MTLRCALESSHENLLVSILEFLLTQQNYLEVVPVVLESESECLEILERCRPDVVILCQETYEKHKARWMPQLFLRHAEIQVIVVNPENNLLLVLGKQEIRIRRVSDLMALIQNHPLAGSREEDTGKDAIR